ncbi:MAG: 30S ribosomal protein S17 [Deltaproteobacteria bacterium]|nr:30S ribosomal protein S17 [Deltaproteobacteria bacterium]
MNRAPLKRMLVGVVVSDKPHQTISVVTKALQKHSFYKKYVTHFTKLAVHDPKNEAHVGDTVEIIECRPLSKTKMWRLKSIKQKAGVEE